MEFDKCIQLVKEACQSQELIASADMILDCATRVFNASRINDGKQAQGQTGQPLRMASEKQLNFLKSLGYVGDYEGLTMADAKAEIDKRVQKHAR